MKTPGNLNALKLVLILLVLLFLTEYHSAYSYGQQSPPQLNRKSDSGPRYRILLKSQTLILRLTDTISSSTNSNQGKQNETTAIVVNAVLDAEGRELIPKGQEVNIKYKAVSGKIMNLGTGHITLSLLPVTVEFIGESSPNCPNCDGLEPGFWQFNLESSIISATNSVTGRTTWADDEDRFKDRKSGFGNQQPQNGNDAANSFYPISVSVPGGPILYGIGTAISGAFKFIFGRRETTLPEGTRLLVRLGPEIRAKYLSPSARTRPLPNTRPIQ